MDGNNSTGSVSTISRKLFVGFGAKWLKVIQSSVQIQHSYGEARVAAEVGRSRRSRVVSLRARWHMVSSYNNCQG